MQCILTGDSFGTLKEGKKKKRKPQLFIKRHPFYFNFKLNSFKLQVINIQTIKNGQRTYNLLRLKCSWD